MKQGLQKVILGIFVLLGMVGFCSLRVSAAQMPKNAKPMLSVSGYEITNETITPGEDFTLTITLQNYSETAGANNVLVVITNPEGVVPEYGTVSQQYIKQITAGETLKLSFNYSALMTVKGAATNFTVSVVSDEAGNATQLRVPVGRMLDFEAEEVTIPDKFTANKTEYVSAMVENLSGAGVNNVVMVARCDEVDIASANIGTMSAGTSKTQFVSVVLKEEGRHTLDLVLTYTDSEGANKEYVISSELVDVAPIGTASIVIPDPDNTGSNNQPSINEANSGLNNIVIICVSGILLIAVCCVIILLINRRK